MYAFCCTDIPVIPYGVTHVFVLFLFILFCLKTLSCSLTYVLFIEWATNLKLEADSDLNVLRKQYLCVQILILNINAFISCYSFKTLRIDKRMCINANDQLRYIIHWDRLRQNKITLKIVTLNLVTMKTKIKQSLPVKWYIPFYNVSNCCIINFFQVN